MVLNSFPRQAFLWILTNQSLGVVRCSFITHLRSKTVYEGSFAARHLFNHVANIARDNKMQLPMTQLSRTWIDAYTVCLGYKETTAGSFKGQGAALPVGPSHAPCYLDRNKNTSLAATEHQRAGVSQKDPA